MRYYRAQARKLSQEASRIVFLRYFRAQARKWYQDLLKKAIFELLEIGSGSVSDTLLGAALERTHELLLVLAPANA